MQTLTLYNYDQMMNRIQFLHQETARLNASGMKGHATLLLVHCAYLITHLRSALEDRTN